MARTFRIYDKNKTIVYEGDNPLIIGNLTENTPYPAQYTMTALEKGYESDPITIPEFRTYLKQSITVAGVETTGEYKTLDVTQAEYLALAIKEENTVYRVQPTDSGSGRVHFLGDKIVDLIRKDNSTLYVRNLFTISNIQNGYISATNDLVVNTNDVSFINPVYRGVSPIRIRIWKILQSSSIVGDGNLLFYDTADGSGWSSQRYPVNGSISGQVTISDELTKPYFKFSVQIGQGVDTAYNVMVSTYNSNTYYKAPEDILATTSTSGGGIFG